MPSYKLIQTPPDKIDTTSIEQEVAQLSARESDRAYRRGTLPESFDRLDDDVCWFTFAIEEDVTIETLDDSKTEKIPDTYPIVFLGSEFLAIGNCTKDTERTILTFLEDNFITGISLEVLTFEEDTLRNIIDEAPDVLKADFKPTRHDEPDQVSATDRKLRGTGFWQRHAGDPISKIKVNLTSARKEVRVGFDEYGVVTLYETSLTQPQQAQVLKPLVDRIVSRYVGQESFQSKLGGT